MGILYHKSISTIIMPASLAFRVSSSIRNQFSRVYSLKNQSKNCYLWIYMFIKEILEKSRGTIFFFPSISTILWLAFLQSVSQLGKTCLCDIILWLFIQWVLFLKGDGGSIFDRCKIFQESLGGYIFFECQYLILFLNF